MRGRPSVNSVEGNLFGQALLDIINTRHELVRLAELIDWSAFDREFGAQVVSTTERPALLARIAAGLLYLKACVCAERRGGHRCSSTLRRRLCLPIADTGGVGTERPDMRLILSHTRGLQLALKRPLQSRQVIEPVIGHPKADSLLARNWL